MQNSFLHSFKLRVVKVFNQIKHSINPDNWHTDSHQTPSQQSDQQKRSKYLKIIKIKQQLSDHKNQQHQHDTSQSSKRKFSHLKVASARKMDHHAQINLDLHTGYKKFIKQNYTHQKYGLNQNNQHSKQQDSYLFKRKTIPTTQHLQKKLKQSHHQLYHQKHLFQKQNQIVQNQEEQIIDKVKNEKDQIIEKVQKEEEQIVENEEEQIVKNEEEQIVKNEEEQIAKNEEEQIVKNEEEQIVKNEEEQIVKGRQDDVSDCKVKIERDQDNDDKDTCLNELVNHKEQYNCRSQQNDNQDDNDKDDEQNDKQIGQKELAGRVDKQEANYISQQAENQNRDIQQYNPFLEEPIIEISLCDMLCQNINSQPTQNYNSQPNYNYNSQPTCNMNNYDYNQQNCQPWSNISTSQSYQPQMISQYQSQFNGMDNQLQANNYNTNLYTYQQNSNQLQTNPFIYHSQPTGIQTGLFSTNTPDQNQGQNYSQSQNQYERRTLQAHKRQKTYKKTKKRIFG